MSHHQANNRTKSWYIQSMCTQHWFWIVNTWGRWAIHTQVQSKTVSGSCHFRKHFVIRRQNNSRLILQRQYLCGRNDIEMARTMDCCEAANRISSFARRTEVLYQTSGRQLLTKESDNMSQSFRGYLAFESRWLNSIKWRCLQVSEFLMWFWPCILVNMWK